MELTYVELPASVSWAELIQRMEWCNKNLQQRFQFLPQHDRVAFASAAEAMLYTLRWS